jgi:hypothetical protein
VNSLGALVPDTNVSPANRYGVLFSPRQSMFVDRFLALKNYFGRANSVLAQFPIREIRSFALLNSREPEPPEGTGEWDKRVVNLEELGYQNLAFVPVGYKYLVASDSRQNGLWTIYQVTAPKTFATLELVRVQNYDTRRYWSYIDWYLPGYNSSKQVITTVPVYSDLSKLSLYQAPVGSSVRVNANSQGKWELKARLYRVSVSDAKFTGTISLNGTSFTEFQAVAQDFSTAIPFQITGQQVQPIVNGISLEGFSITRLQ